MHVWKDQLFKFQQQIEIMYSYHASGAIHTVLGETPEFGWIVKYEEN